MRSESDGHLGAAAFPGLAVREAARRASLAPLLHSVANRYHPSVDDFLAHAESLRSRTGWERSLRLQRVERIRAVDGGFTLDGEGPFAHVLIATAIPASRVPTRFPARCTPTSRTTTRPRWRSSAREWPRRPNG